MNNDIHDRFGRALDRVMTGCISDGYTAGNGTARKVSPDWVHRRLVRGFWGTARVAALPFVCWGCDNA